MEVYRRYFKVENGPIIEAVQEIEKVNKTAHKEYKKILDDIGAEPGYYHRNMRLVSIRFKNEPDKSLFKRKDSGWYPKKNCKEGKALAAKIEAIKTKDPKEALKVIGLPSTPTIFSGDRAHYATIVVIPESNPVAYISVPWWDEDPLKIEQYKKKHAAGKCSDINMEAITWEPTAEMVEIKRWQVDRHIDEWNEQHKKSA